MAPKVGYHVNCVIAGGEGTADNAGILLEYGVHKVYVYEHEELKWFRADCYTDVVADCIAAVKPSSVLIGGTELGRSLAPRLATRFHTGLTADCTKLDIKENTDMIQIRPAFGGNIMAQISISRSRPQFATVRYRVMEKARRVEHPSGEIIRCETPDTMVKSSIEILSAEVLEKKKSLEEEDIIVVAGRGAKNETGVALCRAHQIGLSGRTVRPKLIITCGVSGAIQFTSCMNGSECIVAINSDPEAQIFNTAHYCIVDDLNQIVPKLTELVRNRKED